MRWSKLGRIFIPDRPYVWMHSHAQLPTPLLFDDGRCRVFFASRTAQQRSHVGWFDVDLDRPTEILEIAQAPVLSPGPRGFFDGDGVFAASAVRLGSEIRLYTIGWNAGNPAPLFYAAVGLATSDDGGTHFVKRGSIPAMSRSEHDPCLVTSPWVIKDGDLFRMWYVSGHSWDETPSGLKSQYHIKYAQSVDGLHWERDGRVCIDHAVPEERNIARACVLRERDFYRAWYCYDRGQGYRIGMAISPDGLTWERRDHEAGIAPSAEGWDSEAVCYPAVVEHRGRRFMFYNGNSFGRDGIGLAVED